MCNVTNQMFQAVKQVYNFALWENLSSYCNKSSNTCVLPLERKRSRQLLIHLIYVLTPAAGLQQKQENILSFLCFDKHWLRNFSSKQHVAE